jgi:hypothetical protein
MQTGIFTFYVPGTVDESARRIRDCASCRDVPGGAITR